MKFFAQFTALGLAALLSPATTTAQDTRPLVKSTYEGILTHIATAGPGLIKNEFADKCLRADVEHPLGITLDEGFYNVTSVPCDTTDIQQLFGYHRQSGFLTHKATGLCLETTSLYKPNSDQSIVTLVQCNDKSLDPVPKWQDRPSSSIAYGMKEPDLSDGFCITVNGPVLTNLVAVQACSTTAATDRTFVYVPPASAQVLNDADIYRADSWKRTVDMRNELLQLDDVIFWGLRHKPGFIKNSASRKCWTTDVNHPHPMAGGKDIDEYWIYSTDCNMSDPYQVFRYDNQTGNIRHIATNTCVEDIDTHKTTVTSRPLVARTCRYAPDPLPSPAWGDKMGGRIARDMIGQQEARGTCITIDGAVNPALSGPILAGVACDDMPIDVSDTSFEYVAASDPILDRAESLGGLHKQVIVKTTTSSAKGDPHFKRWNGDMYDFHGGCDLVLVQHPEFDEKVGLHIHVRTKIASWWSYIENAAIKIGDDVLEVEGGPDGGKYWVNGESGQDLETGDTFLLAGKYEVSYKQVSSIQKKYRITLDPVNVMNIETHKEWVAVNIMANGKVFDGSVGLMGSYPTGTMLARDGMTTLDDPDEFGNEWQVLDTEAMLFRSTVVMFPQQCVMPSLEASAERKRRRLGESMISQEDAEKACAHVQDKQDRHACIFDVLAVNDVEMGQAY